MRPEEYPAQEPLSPVGQAYHEELIKRYESIGAGEEYQYGADPYQSIAVYPSSRPNGTVLVFFHGGGWTSGYKEWMAFMAPAFTEAGVTFVVGGYRLAPQHLFPAGYTDCADAVTLALKSVGTHAGERVRLFIGGHSAGGHYAALLATREDWWRKRGFEANPIKGCLPVSGVYRFGEGSGLSARPRFLGQDATTERAASPIEDIADKTPFLIAHGSKDFPHLMAQAEEMEQALRARDVSVSRLVLDGSNHFEASYRAGDPQDIWVPRALSFMESVPS